MLFQVSTKLVQDLFVTTVLPQVTLSRFFSPGPLGRNLIWPQSSPFEDA